MQTYKSSRTWVFVVMLLLFLAACGGGGGGKDPDPDPNPNPDLDPETNPPSVTIQSPSANPTYDSQNGTITLSGIASDDTRVIEVTWVNQAGGTGTAVGTDTWSQVDLKLQTGSNIITVTAKDPFNNVATDTITITYNPNDEVDPQISFISPSQNGNYTTDLSRVSVSGSSSDNIGVTEITWSVDNDLNDAKTVIGENPWIVNDIELAPGDNVITMTAKDAAGNTGTATLTVNYDEQQVVVQAESCMTCHNGATTNNYAGTGITNPHPFSGAQNIRCTVCHGGDGAAQGKSASHVPPPPQIGDKDIQQVDPVAYFNRLTLTGIDKFPDYTVEGVTYSAIDYLQFINPGDLRVVTKERSCGGCHYDNHVNWVMKSPLATETGIMSGATYSAGIENEIQAHRGLYQDTAADFAFRAITDTDYTAQQADIGAIGSLVEMTVISQYNKPGALQLFNNNALYNAANLPNDVYAANEENGTKTNRIRTDSGLSYLYREQISFTCGDCHLGSAGANNRFGDFRSSGCSACHMAYSPDGRSRSTDENVNKLEPANPDAIAAPERPHIRDHLIRNVYKTLPNGAKAKGIDDQTCAGCHQGSNRTVMQYWGIRLDQNQDVTNNFQYPANPVNFTNTANDTRLFDPAVQNNTFNGRNANQYLEFEDYDGDARDDTPADIHHEAGLGCIDCHGSRDLHGGATGDDSGGDMQSRQEQVVEIACESCHGDVEYYAATTPCLTYEDTDAECAMDKRGNPLRHVTRDVNGKLYLKSRLTGNDHYIPQTRDTVVINNKTNPDNNQLIYSPKASYAMGRADGDVATGTGPVQANPNLYTSGFSHSDTMDCASCHSSWVNSCIGCHLAGEYDGNPANYRFSNITGERIVYNEQAADFVYQTPIPFQLAVSANNKITQGGPVEKVFYRYTDINGDESAVFAFSDRNGNGNNPNIGGRNAFPALGHNVMMAHSIRGKVLNTDEGPRYCVACHLNDDSIANFNANGEYDAFIADMQNGNFANLDFNLLQEHIGQNTGNQLNSPYWVHMVAGLGSGVFLFDQTGCPVNPLDANANRQYCPNGAPADNFDVNNVVYDLDRIVEVTGISNASNTSPMIRPGYGGNNRAGAANQNLSGTLGGALVQKLADPNIGVILDSWLDANGNAGGNAANFIQ